MKNDSAMMSEPWFLEAQRLYLEQLTGKLAELRKIGERLSHKPNPEDSEEFYRAFHHLTGSGATYGFPQISELARPICELLRPFRDTGECFTSSALSNAMQTVERLDDFVSRLSIKRVSK